MYDITPETQNKIAMFESYIEGKMTIKDFGRIWVVIVESNICDSINTMVKENEYYTFTCISNYIQENESAPCYAKSLDEFINVIMNDIAQDEFSQGMTE